MSRWAVTLGLVLGLATAGPASAQTPGPEATIREPTAWPESEQSSESECGSIAGLLRWLARNDAVVVRGRATIAGSACRMTSYTSDETAPAAAEGSWRRVVAGVRAFLRAHPRRQVRRELAREVREHRRALRERDGGRVTPERIEWSLELQFRVDASGTIHVTISRDAVQPLRMAVRQRACTPCVAPGPCRCATSTELRYEEASWTDGAYVRVPPRGRPVIVRTDPPAS